ncbi:MAG: 4-hydroxy-tetrahydrodipicolinate reductase [Deltaproteobacteria bacterium]|nr:4-hydroxy-tetrahydrodipicolinate reductase [Deltaproteobacteria bacterium]
MVNITVTGAGGRMGKTIIAECIETNGVSLVSALEHEGNASLGKDAGIISGLDKIGVKIVDSATNAFKKSDVIIDFSAPEASVRNVELAGELGKAIVVGTTGFSVHHRDIIKEVSENTRVVLAPNMSVGVNVLLKLVSEAAKVLGDSYDLEIFEAHHRHKADAPSGTALRIAEVAAHALDRDLEKVAVYERKGIIGERGDKEIGVQTIRAGDIVGDHTVLFAGTGERIELIHRAHSRSTFASGAVRAARWVVQKASGLYDMQDVLGLK